MRVPNRGRRHRLARGSDRDAGGRLHAPRAARARRTAPLAWRTGRAGRSSESDAAFGEPIAHAVGRVAFPFGARGESEDLLRLVVELVSPVGEVEDRGCRHRYGRVVDLDVDALHGDGHPLLEIL